MQVNFPKEKQAKIEREGRVGNEEAIKHTLCSGSLCGWIDEGLKSVS